MKEIQFWELWVDPNFAQGATNYLQVDRNEASQLSQSVYLVTTKGSQ